VYNHQRYPFTEQVFVELVFESYNGISIELVFEFGSAAARRPIRNFSVKPGPYAAYAKFSQNLR
jgi:hypothetical protein